MFLPARLSLVLIRAQLARARTRVATAARRAVTDGIVLGIGAAVAVLAALCALGGAATCPAPPNGTISVAWTVRAAGGVAVTCDSVGARFVALRIRNRASGAATATALPCPNSPGTAPLPPGLYDLSFQLDAADGTRLATAPDQAGVSVVSGRVTQLAPVTLVIGTSAQASLVLSIATGATTNCGPPSAGGAGITGNTITLERAGGGGCAAVTFTRRRGTEARGTYMVNCSSPAVAACIEKGETLTASLDPGSYLVHARGKLATLDCWTRDDTIDVPTVGGTVPRTLGLLRVTGMGCPP